MFNQIKNIDPRTKMVAKAVALRIALPIAIVTVTHVIVNRIEKNQKTED